MKVSEPPQPLLLPTLLPTRAESRATMIGGQGVTFTRSAYVPPATLTVVGPAEHTPLAGSTPSQVSQGSAPHAGGSRVALLAELPISTVSPTRGWESARRPTVSRGNARQPHTRAGVERTWS